MRLVKFTATKGDQAAYINPDYVSHISIGAHQSRTLITMHQGTYIEVFGELDEVAKKLVGPHEVE